jgi:hypothetical protein
MGVCPAMRAPFNAATRRSLVSSAEYSSSDFLPLIEMAMTEKPKETKEERDKTFYSAIGRCISVWAETEGLLIFIAALLILTTPQKAGLIFYSIPNFYAWLSIIDDLFEHEKVFSEQKSEWGKIAERLKKLNDTRVRLAHQTARNTDYIVPPDDVLPSLRPHKFDIRAKSKKHAPLNVEEIIAFISDVIAVAAKIALLTQKIIAVRKASPKIQIEQDSGLPKSEGAQ